MTPPEIPALGASWPRSSLIWGARAGHGKIVTVSSPANELPIQSVPMLDEAEIEALLRSCERFADEPLDVSPQTLRRFCERLHAALHSRATLLLEATRLELAFSRADCEEVVEGALAYVREFADFWDVHRAQALSGAPLGFFEAQWNQKRQIRQQSVPWGTILVVLPQSASLILGVTCLLSALATGNRVILRSPSHCPRSSALLADAIFEATSDELQTPNLSNAISVVLTRARELMSEIYKSPASFLVHYLGSSRHAASLISDSFEHSKDVLVDGEGNVWMWIGEDADPEYAATILAQGALRYNGQTCTSINGALVHPAIYDAVREHLLKRWDALKTGNPLEDDSVQIGPLMDAEQASWCAERIEASGGTVLRGGKVEGRLLTPTIVEDPQWDSEFVTEGVFGPALWLRAGTEEEFLARWKTNRYRLCAGVLSPSADAAWWLARLPQLARLSLNGDPSLEYIFEPWGGYPATGTNPVSSWPHKYERVVAIDEPAN